MIWVFARERARRLDQTIELSTAYRGTAFLLGDVVEADDAYTGAHSREVVDLVLAVCDDLGLDQRSRRKAEFTALLHDVGKIKIPGEIINKPGPLTPRSASIINTHTIEGEKLLLRVGGLLAEVGTMVRSCHEDYDGSGYPDGLAGEAIPLVARIVSACDAYNAMTTTAPTEGAERRGGATRAPPKPRHAVRPGGRRQHHARHQRLTGPATARCEPRVGSRGSRPTSGERRLLELGLGEDELAVGGLDEDAVARDRTRPRAAAARAGSRAAAGSPA